MADEELSMADMTRKMADEREPVQEGSGTIPSATGTTGGSQNESSSDQPSDGRMAQQGHQPAQGTDGGNAAAINAEEEAHRPDDLPGGGAPAADTPTEAQAEFDDGGLAGPETTGSGQADA